MIEANHDSWQPSQGCINLNLQFKFCPPLAALRGRGETNFLHFAYILPHTIFVSVNALGPSVDLNTKM